jgi:hypothetical protein
VKRLAAAVLCVLSAVAAATAGSSRAVTWPCGLPAASAPLWVDYIDANVPFWRQVWAKPGQVVATPPGTGGLPGALRAAGASTVFFDLKLASRVGTPDVPFDPATIVDNANREFDAAVKQTGCATPLIAENELFGGSTQTPWSASNAQYRANVLALLTQLAARGAHPYLLTGAPPYGGDVSGDWWRAVARVADVVREFFPSPPEVAGAGPIVGSRILRTQMRQAIGAFTSMGLPPSRLGLILEFQSGPFGRNGLEPSAKWFEFVKLDALAARQIAAELGLPTVWSWGWATYTQKSKYDVDKEPAACVYVWTRSQAACNGPVAAGSSFDPSLTVGQLLLPPRVFCTLGAAGVIATATRSALAGVTRDPEAAAGIALGWGATRSAAPVGTAQINTAEKAVIAGSFGGNRNAYLAALRRVRANRGLARASLAAQLRRAIVEAGLRVPPVSAAAVASFADGYGDVQARLVTTKTPVAWLGNRTRGFALAGFAPAQVFRATTGRAALVQTATGTVSMKPLEAPLPLAAVPLGAAKGSIVAALTKLAKDDTYEAWLQTQEVSVLNSTVCAADDVPPAAPVELESYVPFLALS